MKKKSNISPDSLLSQNAEELLNKKPSMSGYQLCVVEVLKLLYEPRVHQIEIEIQNEKLLLTNEQEAERSKDKCIELYDFSQRDIKLRIRKLDVLIVFRNRHKKKNYFNKYSNSNYFS